MYRFALIGQTSSGKTCYMATLALNTPHPGGLSAQLKRDLTGDGQPAESPPEGTSEGASFVDDAAAESKGADWITKATRALSQGKLPPPNDPDRYLVDFLIGSEDRGMTAVRMVDYAGEFINQEIEKSEDRTALFRHLQQCDGLLVVAEVLPEDISATDRNVVRDRIGKVADFFGSLHDTCKGHLGTAIAVVLTKWDQHSTIDFDRPEAENAKVREYLQKSLVHQGLVTRVRNFLVEQVDVAADLPLGIHYGNCAVFPASAFGRCVRDQSGGCRPDVDARQPFGLIEPLVWLAARYEEIRTAEIESDWGGSLVSRLSPLSAGRIAGSCSRLLESVPAKSAVAQRLRAVHRQATAATFTAIAVLGLLLVGGIDSLRYLWRRSEWGRQIALVANPAVDDQSLVQARGVFDTWQTTSWPGLLSYIVPPPMDGKAEVKKIDTRRIDSYGRMLDEANESRDAAVIEAAARRYLDKLPTGPRRSEVETIVFEADTRITRAELRTFVDQYKSRIDSVEDEQEIKRIAAEGKQLRLRAKEGDESLDSDYRELVGRIARREQIVLDNTRRRRLQETADGAIARGDWSEAAAVITAATVRDDFWDGVVTRVASQIPAQLESRLKTLVSGENFDTATTAADDAVKALKNVEAAVPVERAAVRKAVTDALPMATSVRRSALDEPYDRHLYQQIYQVKNEANCTRYLNTAPIGGMKSVVQDYREFLESSQKGTTITVTPWIKWGSLAYDVSPTFTIRWTMWAGDKEVAHVPKMKRENPEGRSEALEYAVRMPAEGLDRAIAIKLTMVELDVISENDDIGDFEARITPRDMLEGKTFTVKGKEVRSSHELSFKELKGYRREPTLPSWHP